MNAAIAAAHTSGLQIIIHAIGNAANRLCIQGLYTPESVWMAWKGWDFEQKKMPSPWMTFIIKRMIQRMK